MPEEPALMHLAIAKFHEAAKASFNSAKLRRSILIPKDGNSATCYVSAELSANAGHPKRRIAAAIPVHWSHDKSQIFSANAVFETAGPEERSCPPYILEDLTPTSNPQAVAWRHECARQPWHYEIVVRRSEEGKASLLLVMASATQSVLLKQGTCEDEDIFHSALEAMIVEHPMAEISPLKPPRK